MKAAAASCHGPPQRGGGFLQLPFFDPALHSTPEGVVLRACERQLTTFLELEDGLWHSVASGPLFENLSVGATDLASALETTRTKTGGGWLYLPLLYDSPTLRQFIDSLPGIGVWSRPASPFVDWSDRGRDVWARVVSRLGRQALRRRVRFENLLEHRRVVGETAFEVMLEVESKSWKARFGRDIVQTRQAHICQALLSLGLAEVSAAYDGMRPVAYRLDLRRGDVVYVLKWSFDEAYARYSPGFYLLTLGLSQRWGKEEIGRIDLWGGPDMLKSTVETGRTGRLDLVWPAGGRVVSELKEERRAHDRANMENTNLGRGVRWLYTHASVSQ